MSTARFNLSRFALLLTLSFLLLLAACDAAQPVAPSPTPLVSASLPGSPTADLASVVGPASEHKLFTLKTTRGTLLAEVYPAAAPKAVAAFSQNYQMLKGRGMGAGSALIWIGQDEYETPVADRLVPLETNNLPYKRGSLVLPFDRKQRVNTGSFAILSHDVPASDSSYDYYKRPTYDDYPGYVVIGQVISGFNLLDQTSVGDRIEDVVLTDPPAAAATIAAAPPTPTFAADFQVTHLLTITVSGDRQLRGVLYGQDAPEAVALLLAHQQGLRGATVSDSDTHITISNDGGSEFRPADSNNLPLRRGSIFMAGADGVDINSLFINKHDNGSGGHIIVGQITEGVELLDSLGQSHPSLFGGGYDKVKQIEITQLAAVPTVTPAATIASDQPAIGFSFSVGDKGLISGRLLFPGKIPGKEDYYFVFNSAKAQVKRDRVIMPSDSPVNGIPVPVAIKPNNLPAKRGSILMERGSDPHATNQIVILTRDLAAPEPNLYVVGTIDGGLALLDKVVDGDDLSLTYYTIPAPTATLPPGVLPTATSTPLALPYRLDLETAAGSLLVEMNWPEGNFEVEKLQRVLSTARVVSATVGVGLAIEGEERLGGGWATTNELPFQRGSVVAVDEQRQYRGEQGGADLFGVELGSWRLLILTADLPADHPVFQQNDDIRGYHVVGKVVSGLEVVEQMRGGEQITRAKLNPAP